MSRRTATDNRRINSLIMETSPWQRAERLLSDHYDHFYFQHGQQPAFICVSWELMRDLGSNPYMVSMKPFDPYYGKGPQYRGVPLKEHTFRNTSLIYSPLPGVETDTL